MLAGVAHGRRDVRPVPACFWVSLSDDPARHRTALAEKLAYYGPSISAPMLAEAGLRPQDFAPAARLAHGGQRAAALIDDRMLSLGVAGDAADVIARCRVLCRLGARHLSFGPPLGPDPVTAIRPARRARCCPRCAERSRAMWRDTASRERRSGAEPDMELYDLRVTVEEIGGRSVCGLSVGDYFEVTDSSQLTVPPGGHFCLYALAAVLPLLPAKQRQLPDG